MSTLPSKKELKLTAVKLEEFCKLASEALLKYDRFNEVTELSIPSVERSKIEIGLVSNGIYIEYIKITLSDSKILEDILLNRVIPIEDLLNY